MAEKIEIKRKIDRFLMEWKADENHLPLIIRGARQIGKTYSIRKFGSSSKSILLIILSSRIFLKAVIRLMR